MARIKFDLYFNEEENTWEAINPETGEIKEFNSPKKTSTSKKKETTKTKVDNTNATLTLEANKYILTQAAADLLGVAPDDRIDIKYEKQGKVLVPIIGSNEVFKTKAGNKLTKSLTVSCRGKANEELSNYGNEFTFEPHPTKSGLFILRGNKEIPEPVVDDVVEIDDSNEDVVDVKDALDDLLDSEEKDKVTEITNFNFDI